MKPLGRFLESWRHESTRIEMVRHLDGEALAKAQACRVLRLGHQIGEAAHRRVWL
jgi:hypothetical protein